MNIYAVVSLFGGLAMFLYGMRIMGDGLKKESSGSFKRVLERVTNSPVMGFLIGAGLTALIQSATATIVIVSGLVGAGVLSLSQSIGIILGANVGTTITGQIIRLLDVNADAAGWLSFFTPQTLAPIAAIIGIMFVMFIKTKKSDTVGLIAMGFAILFTGLINMTAAVSPLSESPQFASLFTSFGNKPFLGFLAGFAVSFILQSSSASVGILQALSVTGLLTFSSIYPILIGIYLGDCVTTAIVCSIGTKPDAKRTGIVNILFNLCSMFLIVIVVNLFKSTAFLSGIWDLPFTSGAIANTHTVFKLACAVVLLPLCRVYEKLSLRIVKDNPEDKARASELAGLDEALFRSPALALNSCYKALCSMTNITQENLDKTMRLISSFDEKAFEEIASDEDFLDELSDHVNGYLAKLSPHLNAGLQEDIQNYYLQCVTDFERAGDHVYSLSKCAETLSKNSNQFSDSAIFELSVIKSALDVAMDNAKFAFHKQNLDAAKMVQPYVEVISDLAKLFKERHLERMKKGSCDPVTGAIFLDVLMHITRIGDMCSNIAIHTLVRHNSSVENYEHIYMAALRRGENEEYDKCYAEAKEHFFSML